MSYIQPHQAGFMDFINKTYYGLEHKATNAGLFPFQRFVKEYINEATPYRGVLLFYGLGAGKSRTAVSATESFLAAGKDVVVITPASLQENFKVEFMAYPPPSLRSNPERGLDERFTFFNYNGGARFARSKASGEPGRFDLLDLDNKVLIIDEVHNLVSTVVNAMRSKRYRGVSIYNKIMNAKNLRIVALSGTPIINFPFEVAILINILAGYKTDDMSPWMGMGPKRSIFPESEEEFNTVYLDTSNSKSFQIRPEASRSFRDRLVGYVSYYAGLTGKDVYPELTVMPKIRVPMSNYQFLAYVEQRNLEIEETKRSMKLDSYADGAKGGLDMNLIEKKSSFRSSTREVCNFAFPKEIPRPWRREIKASIMVGKEKKDVTITKMDTELLTEKPEEEEESYLDVKKRVDDSYHDALEETLGQLFGMKDMFLVPSLSTGEPVDYVLDFASGDNDKKQVFKQPDPTPGLVTYSPKMLAILDNILSIKGVKGKDGNIVVYSYFNKVEGINIFQNVLEAAGFEPYIFEKHRDKPKAPGSMGRFCFWSGDNRDQILEYFNDKRNKRGQIIKILLITEAGAEGITVKNVRQLHIMEPYWNEVLVRQVIGRAKRMYSHAALPEDERDVTVFRYEMTFTPEQLKFISRKLGWGGDENFTTDEIIAMIAERKQYATDQIEEFMKETAVDCYLNKTDNDKHRPSHNPIVCYNIKEAVASAASSTTKARFSLTASAADITKTSRYDARLAQKVVTKYYDVVVKNDGVKEPTEFVFVRGTEEKEGKTLSVIKVYLADPVKKQIGMEEFLVATLYIVGEEKDGKLPLMSTRGQVKYDPAKKGKGKAERVKYVLNTIGGVTTIETLL
jgi:superfamily II DNA or RNA helicase